MGTNGSSLSFERQVITMSQKAPNPDNKPSSLPIRDTDGTATNSTTFIAVEPRAQPELVSVMMNPIPGTPSIPDQTKYLKKDVPGSPYVRVSNGGGGGYPGNNSAAGPPNGFPNHCGGGDGGGDVQPDDVSDEFQLDKIGGLEDQKAYLKRSIIIPLACPKMLEEWGVSAPKGILLHGPPGNYLSIYLLWNVYVISVVLFFKHQYPLLLLKVPGRHSWPSL